MDRRGWFKLLCRRIISHIGEDPFKSEEYIDAFLDGTYESHDNREVIAYRVNIQTTGGYIRGEVKLAITLWLLAGGNSLDLGALLDISTR